MGRKPTKAKKTEQVTNELLLSLEFISLVQKDAETTALFRDGHLIATNGVVTVGIPINTNLFACPNLAKMVNALRICGNAFDLTQLPDGALAIKGGTFRARIPCIDVNLAPASQILPDQGLYALDSRFTAALFAVAPIASENATRLIETTVLCRNQTVVASDGKIIFEVFHGINFPELVLPKLAVTILGKTKKEPVTFGVGYNQDNKISSITLHFSDNSWLKSQLYVEDWPNVDRILAALVNCKLEKLAPDFFEACNNVAKFVEPGKSVHLNKATIQDNDNDENAAQVLQIDTGISASFNPSYVKFLSNYVNKIGYSEAIRALLFVGDTARAVLMTMR